MEESIKSLQNTIKEREHVEDIPAEAAENDDLDSGDLYNISFYGADLPFREIKTMLDEGDLIKPQLQRNYVWDLAEASRFIESLLLGLPVPSIFLAKNSNNQYLIVDGYQRIKTVTDFISGKPFANTDKLFRLSSTQRIHLQWRGKAFSELVAEEQRKLKTSLIHAIIFEQKEPRDDDSGMYQIFERINTGGRTLLPQEIRNCIYQGKFNILLSELNKNASWRALYGTEVEDSRMKDKEFILRFFALQKEDLTNRTGTIPLKATLNNFMRQYQNISDDDYQQFKQLFTETMDFLLEKFGSNVFENVNKEGVRTGKFHPTIFEAISLSTVYCKRSNSMMSEITDFSNRWSSLLADEHFKLVISIHTTERENLYQRVALAAKYLYATDL